MADHERTAFARYPGSTVSRAIIDHHDPIDMPTGLSNHPANMTFFVQARDDGNNTRRQGSPPVPGRILRQALHQGNSALVAKQLPATGGVGDTVEHLNPTRPVLIVVHVGLAC